MRRLRGDLGNSCSNGAAGKKKQLGPHEDPLAARRGRQPAGLWQSGAVCGAQQPQQLPMELTRFPSSLPANPRPRQLLARGLHLRWVHIANTPPKYTPSYQTHHPEKHTVV